MRLFTPISLCQKPCVNMSTGDAADDTSSSGVSIMVAKLNNLRAEMDLLYWKGGQSVDALIDRLVDQGYVCYSAYSPEGSAQAGLRKRVCYFCQFRAVYGYRGWRHGPDCSLSKREWEVEFVIYQYMRRREIEFYSAAPEPTDLTRYRQGDFVPFPPEP